MTEQEYIDATNLAKVRTAKTIIHDCLAMRPDEEAMQLEIRRALRRWEEKLEGLVSASPQPGERP